MATGRRAASTVGWRTTTALAVIILVSCGKKEEAVAVAPVPTGPAVDEVEFVSTHENKDTYDLVEQHQDFEHKYDQDYAITEYEDARSVAEDAVAMQLNPKQSWETSPTLPSAWPEHSKQVAYLFYPMANHPNSLTESQLFSAKYRVTVSLVDGTTSISALKSRKLGTVKQRRATYMERTELETAERALIHLMLGGDSEHGENFFWGYLKYFKENPKFGRDIKAKSPRFVQWLYASQHHHKTIRG
jgi:hypothetical protein